MTTSPLSFPSSRPGPEAQLAEHGTFLTALARALVRDSGAADDLAQETLVEALRHRGKSELLAKGSGLRVAVRPTGAPLDLEVGMGPMGASSPLVPIDRQGRFKFAVPSGTYECRVHDAAGSVLKRVTFNALLAANKEWVIE